MNIKNLKNEAKMVNKAGIQNVYKMTIIYLLILWLIQITDKYMNSAWILNPDSIVTMGDAYFGIDLSSYVAMIPSILTKAPSFWNHEAFSDTVLNLFFFVFVFVQIILEAGYIIYLQGIRKGNEMPYITLFDGFMNVGKILILYMFVYALCMALSMFFVIPGIIAYYQYRYAMYNLLEHPEMTIREAMRLSKMQTRGYKMKIFALDVSFIGWYIVSGLTFGIADIWVLPYREQSSIGLFEQIKAATNIHYAGDHQQFIAE